MQKFIKRTKQFIRNEDGIATAWALGWLILCFSIAGLSIDITNAWKVKQFLQSTADVSAHAGGLELGSVGNSNIEAAVAEAANQMAATNMPPSRYGDVLVNNDITVGFWDSATKVFTPMSAADIEIPDAVKVTTRQDGVSSSSVGTYFLRFAGFDEFTVEASATVQRFISICEREGLMSMSAVKIPGGNDFYGRYCVHGQEGVNLSNGNTFESGTTVSMLDIDDCGTSASTCDDSHNPGVEEALRQNNRTFGKVLRLPTTIQNYMVPSWEKQPEYITNPLVETVYQNEVKDFVAATDLVPNSVNVIDCGVQGKSVSLGNLASLNNLGNGTDKGASTIPQDVTLSEMVIVGINCLFTFDASVSFEDAVIATTANKSGLPSFRASSDARLGANDSCEEGGEVALLTTGDVKFAAKLSAYDLEIIASGNVNIAAAANEAGSIHEGTNVWAGGGINLTTGQAYRGCDGNTKPTVDLKYTLRYVE